METPSNPKTEDYTYKQGQYSPRKRKDTTPKVNPQLAVELVFQELKRVEAYTKRIEDATAKKVEIDRGSLESAENRLKNVLADFERQGNRMKNGSYVDKKVSMYSVELEKLGFRVREARASTGKLNGYYVTSRSGTEYKASEIGKGYTLAHIEKTQK
uniref:mobilization protein MbpC n=1 Tax=Bacteroides uniformis TaxID=820 RepID=UPI001F00FF18